METTPDKARLNIRLPGDLDGLVRAYCARTGESVSDVVRRVLVMWVDGELELSGPLETGGRRTGLWIPKAVLLAVDQKIAKSLTPSLTRSVVVTNLLRATKATGLPSRAARGESQ